MKMAFLALAAVSFNAQAQTFRAEDHSFRVVKVVEGLDQPWSLAFLPDGRMLVTEKRGRLRVIQNGKLLPQEIEGLPEVTPHGQGGLHDVVLHPQFEKNQLVYLAYAGRGSDGVGTELARGKLVGNRLEGTQVLFRQSPKGSRGAHFGGRIVFDRQGFVYLTLGDRGEMQRAQKPDDHAGSVIRLHDDGRVPKDNPFAGKAGWKPEKFTLGNRNMQGAALHPQTGRRTSTARKGATR
jgi:aldose sugar dehydrogenase